MNFTVREFRGKGDKEGIPMITIHTFANNKYIFSVSVELRKKYKGDLDVRSAGTAVDIVTWIERDSISECTGFMYDCPETKSVVGVFILVQRGIYLIFVFDEEELPKLNIKLDREKDFYTIPRYAGPLQMPNKNIV